MADAPWEPVFNEQRFTMVSDSMAGDEGLFVDPIHNSLAYDDIDFTAAE